MKGLKERAERFVEFCGQKSKDELSEFYLGADIFAFPSRSEGMPNAVLEAMVYGLPVVMTPCEGSEELIQGNGYICSIDKIKDRIVELCESEELRETMGVRGRERAEKQFSWKHVSEEYLWVFNEEKDK